MNKQEILTRLQEIEDEQTRKIQDLAIEAFKEHVEPYLKENNFAFRAGNGDYWINKIGEKACFEHDLIPRNIRDILDIYVNRQSSLGDWMPEYPTSDIEKEKL